MAFASQLSLPDCAASSVISHRNDHTCLFFSLEMTPSAPPTFDMYGSILSGLRGLKIIRRSQLSDQQLGDIVGRNPDLQALTLAGSVPYLVPMSAWQIPPKQGMGNLADTASSILGAISIDSCPCMAAVSCLHQVLPVFRAFVLVFPLLVFVHLHHQVQRSHGRRPGSAACRQPDLLGARGLPEG